MIFLDLLAMTDDDELRRHLEQRLAERGFDLDGFCHKGGRPELKTVGVTDLARDGGRISFKATVGFTEAVPTTCAGTERNNAKSVIFCICIDERGDIAFTDDLELWDGNEY